MVWGYLLRCVLGLLDCVLVLLFMAAVGFGFVRCFVDRFGLWGGVWRIMVGVMVTVLVIVCFLIVCCIML